MNKDSKCPLQNGATVWMENRFIAVGLFEIHEHPLLLFTPGDVGCIHNCETKGEHYTFFKHKQ